MSPWLAMGCLSPHMMFDELKKSISQYGFVYCDLLHRPRILLLLLMRLLPMFLLGNDDDSDQSDTGLNWLMYELLWRDFFRFTTKNYSDARQQNAAPVTACTGAAA